MKPRRKPAGKRAVREQGDSFIEVCILVERQVNGCVASGNRAGAADKFGVGDDDVEVGIVDGHYLVLSVANGGHQSHVIDAAKGVAGVATGRRPAINLKRVRDVDVEASTDEGAGAAIQVELVFCIALRRRE